MRVAPVPAALVCAGLMAAVVPLRADLTHPSSAQLTVALTTAISLPAGARDAVRSQVQAIWRAEGIHINWAAPASIVPAQGIRVLVVSAAGAAPRGDEHRWPVAELLRDAQGDPVAVASISAARRVLTAAGLADGPDALVSQRLGVVLGRAVAHEIGHYLLNTGGHARHGLMRARIDARDFADLRDGGFGLDADAALWARAALTRPSADGLRVARFVYVP